MFDGLYSECVLDMIQIVQQSQSMGPDMSVEFSRMAQS